MNIKETSPNSQPLDPPIGRLLASRLAFCGAAETMADALDALSEGRTVAAKQLVETAQDAVDAAGREELQTVDALSELPPVWALDAALHDCREQFLAKHAKAHGWRFGWVRGDFIATDDNGFALHVYANDAWRCSSGMPDRHIPGVGLTSLNAHLLGQRLDVTVARLAKWYENSKGTAR